MTTPEHPERGTVMVLTCISMIVLIASAAIAIDMGRRDEQLAGAQHAIDAAVLTGAQYLGTHDLDYAGAAAKVKEVIRQNLGIPTSAWDGCTDPARFYAVAPGDTTCISFRRTVSNAVVKYDVRVKLPQFTMNTIFGRALGVDRVDLAVVAGSNGNTGPTTTTVDQVCLQREHDDAINLAFDNYIAWRLCQSLVPDFPRTEWQQLVCTNVNKKVTYTRPFSGTSSTWVVEPMWVYIWFWNQCSTWVPVADRDAYLNSLCFSTKPSDVSVIYGHPFTFAACVALNPGLQGFDAHNGTTTTSPTTTTTAPGPTNPGTGVPTSLDLSP